MKPFENAKVGDLVYLPNNPKEYPITNVGNLPLFDTIEVFGLNFMLDGTIRGYGNLGQIIFPHPVNIVDGRCCENCKYDKECIKEYKCWFKWMGGKTETTLNFQYSLGWQPKEAK